MKEGGGGDTYPREGSRPKYNRDGGRDTYQREEVREGFPSEGGRDTFPRDGGRNTLPREVEREYMKDGGREGVENYLKEGSEEYQVPTPVYPALTRSGMLTKSDIITMYCRER